MWVSDFLSECDAWTIYDSEKILDELSQKTLCGVISMEEVDDTDGEVYACYAINYPNRVEPVRLYPSTAAQIQSRMAGSGGHFDLKDATYFVAGYTLASILAGLIAGKTSVKMGRGFAFQDNIQLIREVEGNNGT